MFLKYKCGLDIGESVDHSALCMIETRISDDLSELNSRGSRRITHHIVVLRRFDLQDKPEDVEDQLLQFFARDTFKNTGVVLCVETNSIGLRVFRQMRKKGIGVDRLAGVHVGNPREVEPHGDVYTVPKRDLIQPLRRAIQTGVLKIAPNLKWADAFVEELINYEQRLTEAGHLTYGNNRQTEHDDLVMAAAHALFAYRTVGGGSRSVKFYGPEGQRLSHP